MFPPLHSPGFNTLTDTFYEGFLKHELGAYPGPQSCSMPTSLTYEPTATSHHSYIDASSGPLTPQSLHYSSSPLSHTSQPTPEPTDYDFARPQSQGSVHSLDSPHAADMPPAMGGQVYATSSASGSTCTSPLTHAPTPLSMASGSMNGNTGLDIATPFEFSAAEGSTGLSLHDKMYEFASHGGNVVGAMAFPPGYTSLPPHGLHPVTPTSFGSAAGSGPYSHYDYELLQLMGPNPDDLLSDPFCSSIKDVKPLVANVASPSSCPTPIH